MRCSQPDTMKLKTVVCFYKMEEETQRNYCRRMICLLRSKQQQHLESPEEERRRRHEQKGAGGRERSVCEREAEDGDEFIDHRLSANRGREQTSPGLMCQGPEVQPVPPQLISTLRLKTFEEKMRRAAAEVELHDPAVCSACEQEQASLALKTFIRRKKTQLQVQTLKGRLNTHLNRRECAQCWSMCNTSHSPSMPLTGFGGNYLVDICRSQQPGVALATTKERGVALATDEMRGYPDKNATGTHLASPRCPLSDR